MSRQHAPRTDGRDPRCIIYSDESTASKMTTQLQIDTNERIKLETSIHTFRKYKHGGNSKGNTCVVDRDVTAYLVVYRVLRLPTEQYGCRYVGHPGFNDVKVNCLGIFCYFTFRICFEDIFSFLRKA